MEKKINMRTIKFRGMLTCEPSLLGLNRGDWCTGFYHEDLHCGEWKSFIKCGELNLEVDKDTVGQFTGLLDKNGTEIYEGDIVTFDNHLQGISQVVYDYAGFEVISKNYRTALRPMMNNHIRVIGNIHDNQR